ncbi:hypothetical protein AAC387_Pa07g1289 [Persea americana]
MGEEALPSPKNKVKFLCSHGGKILPRPSDGQLKYVGGETRVVAVPRTITFSELKRKLNSLMEGDMVLKYQMMPEDLDTLVSVKTDEDLKHMIDEYDRHGSCGSPKFRAFLFPPSPFLINDNHQSATSPTHSNPGDHNAMEQRYIDAINGVLRTASNASIGRPTFTISSGGSSPNSIAPDTFPPPAHETMNQENALYDGICNPSRPFGGSRNSRMQSMQRVHSSPSLSSLGQQQNQPHLYHHLQQQQQQYSHQMRIPPRMPVSPRIAPSESSQQGRYIYQVGQQRVTGACGGGYSGHVDGWNTSYRGGAFMDADSIPQLSTKPIGARSSKWNNHGHGLDYR